MHSSVLRVPGRSHLPQVGRLSVSVVDVECILGRMELDLRKVCPQVQSVSSLDRKADRHSNGGQDTRENTQKKVIFI